MPTKMKAARRQSAHNKVAQRRIRSAAENCLRDHLHRTKRMKSPDDDAGLVEWLRGLGRDVNEDHRSQWEKDLQARVEHDLATK